MKIHNLKRNLSYTMLAALAITPIVEAGYQMRAAADEKFSTWERVPNIESSWVNQGSHFSCNEWNPSPLDVALNQSFVQSRNCQQNQVRTVTVREYDSFSGAYRTITVATETRSISELESRSALGEGSEQGGGNSSSSSSSNSSDSGDANNWADTTPTVSSWTTIETSNVGDWAPSATNQIVNFTQSISTSSVQEQFTQAREYNSSTSSFRNKGAPVRTTRTMAGDDASRNVAVVGGAVTTVSSTCSVWTPAEDAVSYGTSFTQSRSCDVSKSQTYSFSIGGSWTNTWAESVPESQQASGTNQEWTPAASTFTAWENVSAPYAYVTWGPVVSNQTNNFTQSRTYSQDQSRYEQLREIDMATGQFRNTGSPILRTQTLTTQAEYRQITATETAWNNISTSAVTAWTPASGNQIASYAQGRTYTQNRERLWTYTDSNNAVLGTYTQSSALTGQNENRTVVVTASAWADINAPYECTTWTPSAATIPSGQSFTQSRNCSQDQARTLDHKVDSITVHTRNETQKVLAATFTQQEVGTQLACHYYRGADARKDAGFTGNTYVHAGANNWYYNGLLIASGKSAQSIIYNGKTYSRGALVNSSFNLVEICD
jgi:hypothetical protein